eukprot:s534_g11.t11
MPLFLYLPSCETASGPRQGALTRSLNETYGIWIDLPMLRFGSDKSCMGSLAKKCRNLPWPDAVALLQKALHAKAAPNIATHTSVIAACGKGSNWSLAVGLLQDARSRQLRPDVPALNSALTALGRAGRWREATVYLDLAKSWCLHPSPVSFGALLDALARATRWQRALCVLDDDDTAVGLIAFNSALTACERASEWGQAMQLLQEMREFGPHPDIISVNAVLEHCDSQLLDECLCQWPAMAIRLRAVARIAATPAADRSHFRRTSRLLCSRTRLASFCGTAAAKLSTASPSQCGQLDQHTHNTAASRPMGEGVIPVLGDVSCCRCSQHADHRCRHGGVATQQPVAEGTRGDGSPPGGERHQASPAEVISVVLASTAARLLSQGPILEHGDHLQRPLCSIRTYLQDHSLPWLHCRRIVTPLARGVAASSDVDKLEAPYARLLLCETGQAGDPKAIATLAK